MNKTETKPTHIPIGEKPYDPINPSELRDVISHSYLAEYEDKIVRAVNSHEELLEALKNIVSELDHQFPDAIREPLRSLVVKADQAIAKAEGK